MQNLSRIARTSAAVFIWVLLLVAGASTAFAQEKCDSIDANAMGTSTQMGRIVPVKFFFCKESTPEDRQTLVDAYMKGKKNIDSSQYLTQALQKMPSAGRISLPGTVGFSIAYVRVVPTATGRQIRFITDRRVNIGEAMNSGRSLDYSLTAGMIEINEKDKGKSTGVLYPATYIKLDREKKELTWELRQNPWKLQNIIDWGNKDKEK
jgi:hypothetical protein